MRVLIFSKTFVWNISHSKKKWARYDKNVYWYSCKVPFILVRIWWNSNFIDRFSKNFPMSNFMKIRPVGAELFHADRQTDGQTGRHDEANSRFSQFCERAETFKFQILYE